MLAILLGSSAFAVDAPKVNFEDHVKPVFREHCLSCHNQNEKKGGLALDSYAGAIDGGGSGEIVFDGDAAGSRLYQLMAHEDTPEMPPQQPKVAEAKLVVIRDWINGGLLETSGSKAKRKTGPSLSFSLAAGGKPEGPPPMPETTLRQPVVTPARAAAASALAASPWAPLVAIGGEKQVLLYHADTGELLGVLPFPEGQPQTLRFSRDGGYLVVGGGRHAMMGIAAIYDVKSGERVSVVGDELESVLGADVNDRLTRVALGGPQKMLRIFDVGSGEKLFELKKHTDWIYAVAFSPDGVLIASGDRAGGLHLWEAETGRFYLDLVGHKAGITGISWRPDGNVVASSSEDGTIKLWDVFEGKNLKSWDAHGGGATDVVFAQDGQIVTCGIDKTVKVWDANGTQKVVLPAMAERVLEVAVVGDGHRVIAGDWTGTYVSWKPDQPADAVILVANPPTLEQRIVSLEPQSVDASNKSTASQANAVATQQAYANATSEHTKRIAELEAQKKIAAESDAKTKQLQPQLDAAKLARVPIDGEYNKSNTEAGLKQAVLLVAQQGKTQLNSQLPAAEQKYVAANSAKSTAEAQASEMKSKFDALKTQLDATSAQFVEAERILAAASEADKAAVEQKKNEIVAARDVIAKSVAETETLLKPIQDSLPALQATFMAAEAEKLALMKLIEEANALFQKSTGEVDEANKKVATYVEPLKQQDAIIVVLDQQLQESAKQMQDATAMAAALTPQVDQFAKAAEAAKLAMDAAANEAKLALELSARRQSELQTARDNLAKFQALPTQLQTVTQQAEQAMAQLVTQMKQPQDQLAAVLSEQANRQTEMDKIALQLAELQKQVALLQAAQAAAQPKVDEAKQQVAQMQTASDEAESKLSQAKSKLEFFSKAYGGK